MSTENRPSNPSLGGVSSQGPHSSAGDSAVAQPAGNQQAVLPPGVPEGHSFRGGHVPAKKDSNASKHRGKPRYVEQVAEPAGSSGPASSSGSSSGERASDGQSVSSSSSGRSNSANGRHPAVHRKIQKSGPRLQRNTAAVGASVLRTYAEAAGSRDAERARAADAKAEAGAPPTGPGSPPVSSVPSGPSVGSPTGIPGAPPSAGGSPPVEPTASEPDLDRDDDADWVVHWLRRARPRARGGYSAWLLLCAAIGWLIGVSVLQWVSTGGRVWTGQAVVRGFTPSRWLDETANWFRGVAGRHDTRYSAPVQYALYPLLARRVVARSVVSDTYIPPPPPAAHHSARERERESEDADPARVVAFNAASLVVDGLHALLRGGLLEPLGLYDYDWSDEPVGVVQRVAELIVVLAICASVVYCGERYWPRSGVYATLVTTRRYSDDLRHHTNQLTALKQKSVLVVRVWVSALW